MLVDCGAIDNLTGDKWVVRSEAKAKKHGQGTSWMAMQRCEVEGVGSGSSVIEKRAIVPVCLSNGNTASFNTAVVSDSELPALLGLDSLESHKAIIDTHNHQMIFPGPGGYNMTLSPGSVSLKLEKARSGHLLLPSSEWEKLKVQASAPQLQL